MGDGVHFDLALAVAGLLVGFTVGLTGMGGGALMTPILVLLFRVQPLAAVSSDLVASFIMKPVGGGVHLRRGTVNFALVKWLMVGSVPAAFAGVLVLRRLGDGAVVRRGSRRRLGSPWWPPPRRSPPRHCSSTAPPARRGAAPPPAPTRSAPPRRAGAHRRAKAHPRVTAHRPARPHRRVQGGGSGRGRCRRCWSGRQAGWWWA